MDTYGCIRILSTCSPLILEALCSHSCKVNKMYLFYYRDKKDGILEGGMTTDGNVFSPPLKRPKMMAAPAHNERLMLYVRQDGDEVYTPLHVVPPTTQGLLNAVSNYRIQGTQQGRWRVENVLWRKKLHLKLEN